MTYDEACIIVENHNNRSQIEFDAAINSAISILSSGSSPVDRRAAEVVLARSRWFTYKECDQHMHVGKGHAKKLMLYAIERIKQTSPTLASTIKMEIL